MRQRREEEKKSIYGNLDNADGWLSIKVCERSGKIGV